jgi:Arc/MetJ-type ribon-helix-helix transcriptional regulator
MKKISVKFSDEEIDFIESQGKSFYSYLRELVRRDQTQNLQTEGSDGRGKIDFQSLIGEELFAKVQAEAGENFEEYLRKALLLQTDKNTISLSCPEEEIAKIDAGRNGKSRAEYLRGLLATDQKKEVAPPELKSIEGQITEGQKALKDQSQRHHEETSRGIAPDLSERRDNPFWFFHHNPF